MSDTEAAPLPAEIPDSALRLAEAMLFAAAAPVGARALGQILPTELDADAVLATLRQRYQGRGVELVEVSGGWQFRTAPDLAAALRRVVQTPRRLPRAAMEVLAVVAYHQPVTRAEIEALRGTSLSQATLDVLLESGLVAPAGHRDVAGRPTVWKTTPAFLAQFGLRDLRELPKREDLLVEPPSVLPPPAEPDPAADAGADAGATAQEGAPPEPAAGAADGA